ncbi:coenzyme Q-binding protein COQ10 homolog B, mitochondrial [Brevipalpus obovatus]|uniref:coenzyme Q-binding protein COQ10 homolog B, mitochondrial n=1 Tax=Brevipalpus obovatus TaxID=246614 RepID=UPI003D9DC3E4
MININQNVIFAKLCPLAGCFRRNFFSSSRKVYKEQRLLGYSKEQMFKIVSRVEDYHLFLPACTKSMVLSRTPKFIKAELEIGFPPMIVEKYASHVTLERPTLVRAQCFDGRLFKHLITEWRFSDGLSKNSETCTIDFFIDFEFKSPFYAKLANAVFDQMVHQTINCFLQRAKEVYGRPRLKAF